MWIFEKFKFFVNILFFFSDTDYSSDCSTDSELSNFDAGFYDEDIESLEQIERGSELECIGLSGHTLFKELRYTD